MYISISALGLILPPVDKRRRNVTIITREADDGTTMVLDRDKQRFYHFENVDRDHPVRVFFHSYAAERAVAHLSRDWDNVRTQRVRLADGKFIK